MLNVFSADDATWLDNERTRNAGIPTVIAFHQPRFETGRWWMDCVGLKGADQFEAVARRHSSRPQTSCSSKSHDG